MVEFITVADPDLQIKGGGGSSHLDPEIRGGGLQKIFSALQTSVWSKNKGGGAAILPLICHCIEVVFTFETTDKIPRNHQSNESSLAVLLSHARLCSKKKWRVVLSVFQHFTIWNWIFFLTFYFGHINFGVRESVVEIQKNWPAAEVIVVWWKILFIRYTQHSSYSTFTQHLNCILDSWQVLSGDKLTVHSFAQ